MLDIRKKEGRRFIVLETTEEAKAGGHDNGIVVNCERFFIEINENQFLSLCTLVRKYIHEQAILREIEVETRKATASNTAEQELLNLRLQQLRREEADLRKGVEERIRARHQI